MITYYELNSANEVVSKISGHTGEDIPGMNKTENEGFDLGDIYDFKSQTFRANPRRAIAEKIAEIDAQLAEIDMKLIRTLAEISAGIDTSGKAAGLRDKYIAMKAPLQKYRAELDSRIKGT